jgi:LDH2 family malate/lactate/ureidoglycolate dehydrogenase
MSDVEQSLGVRLERAATSERLPPSELSELARDAFAACGLSPEDAALAAEVGLYAQLRGSDSHGLIHLPLYVIGLLDRTIQSQPEMKFSGDMACTRVLDAGAGLGLVAGRKAIDTAIELASQYGLGAVAVRNSSHFGVAGYYADRAAERGLIGLAFSNAAPAMAPTGSKQALLGTNPIAAAFPVPGENTIVADMATTKVARSRIRHAKTQGQSIPADWALDPEGRPTTDPDLAIKGTVQPIGGPKGFALGLMVEMLCSAVSDGQPGMQVTYENLVKRPSGISQFFLVLNPAGFAGAERYGARAAHLAAAVRAAQPIDPATPPRLAGARGHEVERQARSEGIRVSGMLASALRDTAKLLSRAAA